ncbi:MAG: transglutaminase domain-containing protein, partial [Deltaproteobacteria bacterium]
TYNIRNVVTVSNRSASITKLVVMLPLPQSNPYQTVTNMDAGSAEVLPIPETDDQYARYTSSGGAAPQSGQTGSYGYTCRVTTQPVNMDVSKIQSIPFYETSSTLYQNYTGASGVYVDPDNATIKSVGSSLLTKSSNLIDYARRCYEYVIANYIYMNPLTGLHPLAEVLAVGGGDCGNLSSIYVSLLRYAGIPARHIVTIRPNGSPHVWADFYVEGTGWIPVDVTYRSFASYDGNGVVLTKGVWLLLEKEPGNTYRTALFQGCEWWWWGSGSGVTVSQSFLGTN